MQWKLIYCLAAKDGKSEICSVQQNNFKKSEPKTKSTTHKTLTLPLDRYDQMQKFFGPAIRT